MRRARSTAQLTRARTGCDGPLTVVPYARGSHPGAGGRPLREAPPARAATGASGHVAQRPPPPSAHGPSSPLAHLRTEAPHPRQRAGPHTRKRPSSALPSVTASAYSRSAPMGRPIARREVSIPMVESIRAR